MMKRMILLAGMTVAMLTATAQDNPYIVKTKNVKKTAVEAKDYGNGRFVTGC